jgi:hypothetical protein
MKYKGIACLLVDSLPVAQSIFSSKFEEKMDYAQTLWARVLGLGLSLGIHYKLNLCIKTQSVYGHCEAHPGQFCFGPKKH